MKIPEHPAAGLLWRTLQRNRLDWLEKAIPEDFWQECQLFLLGWSRSAVDADPRAFARAASRHFYQVAVKYGFRRPRGSPRYVKSEHTTLGSLFEDAEEGRDSIRVAIRNWHSQENSGWLKERLEFCRRILQGPNNSGSGKIDWYLFQGYLSGYNLNEIALLTGWKTGSFVKKRLGEIIRRLREAAGIDPNLPLPPMPKKGKVELRQGKPVGAGSQPNPGKPRQAVVNPRALANLPLKEIMARFGVSKATASRLRRRGWYCPDYHRVEPGSREWLRRQKRSQPILA